MMKMDKKVGTIAQVLMFGQPWPPLEQVEISSKSGDEIICKLEGTTDGCLLASISLDQAVLTEFKSQPISVTGRKWVAVFIRWSNSKLEAIRINKTDLKSYSEEPYSPFAVINKEEEINEPHAFDNPEANTKCREWMDWRKNRYSNLKQAAKKNRKSKGLNDQVNDLRTALASLIHFKESLDQGKDYLVGHLAAELRALVYWNGKNYSPLLLRVAGRFGLPLPVYLISQRNEAEHPLVQKAYQWVMTNEPALEKTLSSQEIVDIQEWLSSPVQILRNHSNDTPNSAPEKTTMDTKGLILDFSTAFGAAHYDEDSPDQLVAFDSVKVFGTGLVKQFLLRTSNIVIELSRFVLAKAEGVENAE